MKKMLLLLGLLLFSSVSASEYLSVVRVNNADQDTLKKMIDKVQKAGNIKYLAIIQECIGMDRVGVLWGPLEGEPLQVAVEGDSQDFINKIISEFDKDLKAGTPKENLYTIVIVSHEQQSTRKNPSFCDAVRSRQHIHRI